MAVVLVRVRMKGVDGGRTVCVSGFVFMVMMMVVNVADCG